MNKKINPLLFTVDDDYDDASQQALMSWAEEAIEKFLSSSFSSTWRNNKKELASFFIYGFIDYAYGYQLAKPFQYNESVVREICLDIFPRKMSTDAKDFKQAAEVLIAFFEWCQTEGTIENSNSLIKVLKKIDSDIYQAAKNPSNWGMAKSFFSRF